MDPRLRWEIYLFSKIWYFEYRVCHKDFCYSLAQRHCGIWKWSTVPCSTFNLVLQPLVLTPSVSTSIFFQFYKNITEQSVGLYLPWTRSLCLSWVDKHTILYREWFWLPYWGTVAVLGLLPCKLKCMTSGLRMAEDETVRDILCICTRFFPVLLFHTQKHVMHLVLGNK